MHSELARVKAKIKALAAKTVEAGCSEHEALHASRRWSLLGHYYDGPSPYGQFFRSGVTYYGVGLHFAL